MNRSIVVAALLSALLLPLGVSNSLCEGAKHKFMGVANCKMCHNKKDTGDQYNLWKATSHSKAWETLGTDKAKEAAAKKGIKGNPQEAPECLKCHTVAHDEPADNRGPKYDIKEGVQCENCHGAGGDYAKKEIMKDKDKSIAAGLVIPDEKVCIKCHNSESPFYKEFKFEEFKKKIAHPLPPKK